MTFSGDGYYRDPMTLEVDEMVGLSIYKGSNLDYWIPVTPQDEARLLNILIKRAGGRGMLQEVTDHV
jgi:hypothetical protein